jgi:hypothetical protein
MIVSHPEGVRNIDALRRDVELPLRGAKQSKKSKIFFDFLKFFCFFVSIRQLMVSRWSENQVLSLDARQSIKKMKKTLTYYS